LNMDISIFGSSLVSAWWNGAATYYRGLLRALAALGHRLTFYEPEVSPRREFRDMEDPDWARVVVYPAEEDGVYRALESARGADVIIKAAGIGVCDELLERAVLESRSPGTAVIFWDVNAPATLDRIQHDWEDPFRALIPKYDFILTRGGGAPVVVAYRALGARDCFPIYNALDPDVHHPVPFEERFAGDLLFLGNRHPDREERVDRFFLQPAIHLPHRHFLLGGDGWHDKSLPANVRYLGHVFTADHNALNGSALAVLNLCRPGIARYGFSPPARIFEAAGAAACLITDPWKGLEEFLEPGKEILVAKDAQEVVEHLRRLGRMEARVIGKAALQRVLADHTYTHRAAQVDGLLQGRAVSLPLAEAAREEPAFVI
jgi:spore maturation protein CgeB